MLKTSRKRDHGSSSSYRPRMIFIALLVVGFAAVMFWPRHPVELDEHGYKIATALYRVCNQQSVEGLKKIEELLLADKESPKDLSESESALVAIIETAKKGQWENAEASCRQAMEDQVRR